MNSVMVAIIILCAAIDVDVPRGMHRVPTHAASAVKNRLRGRWGGSSNWHVYGESPTGLEWNSAYVSIQTHITGWRLKSNLVT